jgi:hypothetical protein
VTPRHQHPKTRATNAGPSRFPRGEQPDVFPAPAGRDLVAVAVFTTYELPGTPVDGVPYTPPNAGAICACGDAWLSDSAVLLRKMLGGHSCAEKLGRPIELVPIDKPTDEIVARVLDGLRRL